MKIVIIEDEPLVARDIQSLIARIEPGASVLAVLASAAAARQWFLRNDEPDLILSDVQLSDGISFEVFEEMPPACPVIFTTAYDEFAIRAFRVNSIDYLLKPIDQQELARAFAKFKGLQRRDRTEELRHMLGGWREGKLYKERFLVAHGNALVPVVESNIAFFHKEQLIYLHTINNEKFISEFQALDELEQLLNPDNFFRVNRQYILHIRSVAKVRSSSKGLVVTTRAPFVLELDLSREKAAAFKKWLG